eukprot:6481255-Alexandrium_andersonii.AAC.1
MKSRPPKIYASFFSRSVQARAERRRKRLALRLDRLERRIRNNEIRLQKRTQAKDRVERAVQRAVISGTI